MKPTIWGKMGDKLTITEAPLEGALVIESRVLGDYRGGFARLFCKDELREIMGEREIVQINYSHSIHKGTLRGLHFQYPPAAESKIVRCIRGKVWDVAVDLRRDSPTFMQWHAVELSPEASNAFFIPEGFAHGFQTRESNSELLYLHTEFYSPKYEGGIHYTDPKLNITWPLSPTHLSERDRSFPVVNDDFKGVRA